MKKASDLRIPFTWQERRPIILDRAMYIPGYYGKHHEWGKLSWADERLFGNDKPTVIEFCCGNGQWIGEQAQKYPEYNWIGVDRLFERARKVWAKIHRENIPNLFVVCADALTFVRHYIPPHSAHAAHINFPDPWPKLRHAKNRLVNQEFLDALSYVLAPNGRLYLATDDFPYVEWALKEFSLSPGWMPIHPPPHYVTNIENFGRSFFNDLWTKQGRTIYHLEYTHG